MSWAFVVWITRNETCRNPTIRQIGGFARGAISTRSCLRYESLLMRRLLQRLNVRTFPKRSQPFCFAPKKKLRLALTHRHQDDFFFNELPEVAKCLALSFQRFDEIAPISIEMFPDFPFDHLIDKVLRQGITPPKIAQNERTIDIISIDAFEGGPAIHRDPIHNCNLFPTPLCARNGNEKTHKQKLGSAKDKGHIGDLENINENKISDGYRKRAQIVVKVF
jgi:hypothetical protein